MKSAPLSPRQPFFSTTLARAVAVLAAAILLGGALAVPFAYETQTLWYKTGINRIMLRTGQLHGMLALVLLVVQVLLAVRPRFLEKAFGGATLLRWHRTNGVLIALVAIGHVGLVLGPEGWANLPIGGKYWPEMTGGALLLLLLVTAVTSRFRANLHLDFATWRRWHRLAGYLAPLLVGIHVLFVSDSFAQGLPRVLLLAAGMGLTLIVVLTITARNQTEKQLKSKIYQQRRIS